MATRSAVAREPKVYRDMADEFGADVATIRGIVGSGCITKRKFPRGAVGFEYSYRGVYRNEPINEIASFRHDLIGNVVMAMREIDEQVGIEELCDEPDAC